MSDKLSKDEERMIAVLRAIKKFDQPALINADDTSAAIASLESVTDIEEPTEDFIYGFVVGLGASRLPEVAAQEAYEAAKMAELGYAYGPDEIIDPPDDDQELSDERPKYPSNAPSEAEEAKAEEEDKFVGGPSSGVAVGQLEGDPRYVHQTGPQKGKK